jgi:hypothetical protein
MLAIMDRATNPMRRERGIWLTLSTMQAIQALIKVVTSRMAKDGDVRAESSLQN